MPTGASTAIVGGVTYIVTCGCGQPDCKQAGKHPKWKWSQLGVGEKAPIRPDVFGPPGPDGAPGAWLSQGDGVGIATGSRSGCFVIDLDVKPAQGIDGVRAFIELGAGRDCPTTLMVKTPSGGYHVYFKYPAGDQTTGRAAREVRNSASKIAHGVDVRGEGGYTVLPPTLHKSGGRYEFFGLPPGFDGDPSTLIAEAPEWLVTIVASADTASREAGGLWSMDQMLSPRAPVAPMPTDILDRTLGPATSTVEGIKHLELALKRLRKALPGQRNDKLFREARDLGRHERTGDLHREEAWRSIYSAISDAGWGDVRKCEDTFLRGWSDGASTERPVIRIDSPNWEQECDRAVAALVREPDIYVKGNMLLKQEASGAMTVVGRPLLNELLSRCVTWVKVSNQGTHIPVGPPQWSSSILERTHWPEAKVLRGESAVPVVRPDGSVWTEKGYDSVTGVMLTRDWSDCVGLASGAGGDKGDGLQDRATAVAALCDVVSDFPWATRDDLAAFFAALLTPLALWAYEGGTPIFIFEASAAGSGKTLLANVAGMIASGGTPQLAQYADAEDEFKKTLVSWCLSCKPLFLIDNVTKKFGNQTLCTLSTSPDRSWSNRLLGQNKEFVGHFNSTLYVTSNNLRFGEDMERRCCVVRLEPTVEDPSARSGYKHRDLLKTVRERLGGQKGLVWAAVSLLSGYLKAVHANGGEGLDTGKERWGSFENWLRVVGGTLRWCGNVTLDSIRQRTMSNIEEGGEDLHDLVGILARLDEPLSVKELWKKAYGGGLGPGPKPTDPEQLKKHEAAEALRDWLEDRFQGKGSPKLLSYTLRSYKGKVRGSLQLSSRMGHNHTLRWFVEDARARLNRTHTLG